VKFVLDLRFCQQQQRKQQNKTTITTAAATTITTTNEPLSLVCEDWLRLLITSILSLINFV
jgi:hypothetical protein